MAEHPKSKSAGGFNSTDGSPCSTICPIRAHWGVLEFNLYTTDVDGAVPVQLCGGGGGEHADADRRDLHPAQRLQAADAAARAHGRRRDHRAHVQGGARQEEHRRAKGRENSNVEGPYLMWIVISCDVMVNAISAT